MLQFFETHSDILACPRCAGPVSFDAPDFRCRGCAHAFEVRDGIPSFFLPNDWDAAKPDVTTDVRAFYEETPFPNYDDFDSAASLVEKAQHSVFTRLLDEQLPPDARVLEVGCGTGQMTNFLSAANRTVIGADMTLASLRLGNDFARRNQLTNAHFMQMNLFRPALRPGLFDLVFSNGVLHATTDPFLAYKTIASLVRPGGYLLVGLYHKYGRLITDTRRLLFRLSGDRFTSLDPRLRIASSSTAKKRAWFMDQYKHPHESKHLIGEMMQWMDAIGLDFVRSIPRSFPPSALRADAHLFEPERRGSALERFLVESAMALRGSDEGGFFLTLGRRPIGAASATRPAES